MKDKKKLVISIFCVLSLMLIAVGVTYSIFTYTKQGDTKLYTIVNDANSNGTADIGDEITIGTESFYVISNDGTNINALAKYNLNVGDYALTGTTGIQNASAIGYPTSKNVTVPFSSDSQKGTNYSDYSGSIVEGYVNNYVTYLNTNNTGLNATGRLILKEELETLGCSSSGYSYTKEELETGYLSSGYPCTNAPSWVYSTSYWSGSSFGTDFVWIVFSEGSFDGSDSSDVNYFGVRPVITLES